MSFDLEAHLAEEHKMTPFSSYLKEIVYGGNDGIITTFAVVAGFNGAGSTNTAIPILSVLLFGFANLFADGVSMAMGNYMSSQSEMDVYEHSKQRERDEIRQNPDIEKEESIEILKRKGYSAEDAKSMVSLYAKNESYWLNFMMNQELELPNPEKNNPIIMSVVTYLAFVGFGMVPLIPYLVVRTSNLFIESIFTTAIALILLGILRSRVVKTSRMLAIIQTFILGGVAALVAYGVGRMFRGY